MEHGTQDSGVNLAELLAAFSLATDLGLGQPMEHVLRSWQIAARLGTHVGIPEDQRPSLFYVAMLAWVGCVADAPEVATSFGDDIAFRTDSYEVDLAGLTAFGFFLGHAGAGGSVAHRLRIAAALAASGGSRVAQGIQGHCLTTSTLAERLGLGADVSAAVRQFFARWDGRGVPGGVGGADIALPVRLFHLADVVEVHHRKGGVDAALRVARARRGKQFDPSLVDAFCALVREVLPDELDMHDAHDLIADEPGLLRRLSDAQLDEMLEALADFTDLRCANRAGHSRGTAELADAAARRFGLPAADVAATRRAGYVHDIGLHGVPVTVLDKAGPLSATEWERLRASSYYTERVLARPPALARIGAIAALAHERMNGTGYHRGISGAPLPMTGRILAAACAFRAMTEPRAHRPALTARQAVAALRTEAHAGRLDADAADAVLSAAGAGGRRRVAGPAGLTARELEVLVLIARGAATNDVARQLGISRKTAATHIERIYAKTGTSSRSTATLFALRNGLLDPLDL
ncbi:MAG TPA: HD domain-containing phosphohydrolase [Jiangellales bacterium]|nr:HD domain-containing phosphohydrolase [Jiangellales bacterium]